MSAVDRSWLSRFRSSSLSSDLDVEENASANSNKRQSNSDLSKARDCRSYSISTVCDGTFQKLSADDYKDLLKVGREMLLSEPDCFPFDKLPESCKLTVFAALNPASRGTAARTCKEWSVLMRNPLVWKTVDLLTFPPYPASSATGDDGVATEDSLQAYEAYRTRVKRYMNYLVKVRPAVRILRFELDIGDVKDGWLDVLTAFFYAAQLQDLTVAHLGWTDTPAKPFSPDMSSATWCTNDTKDLMYRHRHRQRLFVKFFDLFTAVASNITSLTMPFDWTERSLRALRRLPNLETLELQKYFIVQAIDQTMIDTLFSSVPFLRRLTMEVWSPSGRGLQSFQLRSESLEFLDVSNCRGFCFDEVALPSLVEFRVSICPMNGPLISAEGVEPKCLYEMLRTGAPNLRRLNKCELKCSWKENIYDELDTLLKSVCACSVHQVPE
jgi:hypothetical protein